MFEKPSNWSQGYWDMISRNIGIVSIKEQSTIKASTVAICGIGGLGGPLAKQLVRAGIEKFRIVDKDIFDPTNMNRQVCNLSDMGRVKVDVLEEQLVAINPDVKVQKLYEITEDNIDSFLDGVDVAVLTLDGPVGSIIVTRACRRLGIPLIESWAVPYQVAWWFLPDSKSYEECYGLDTSNRTIKEIDSSPDTITSIKKAFFSVFERFPGIEGFYSNQPGAVEAMIQGKLGLRSFCPNVRMTSCNLANEVVFAGILERMDKIIAPRVEGYDYFNKKTFSFAIA